MPVNSDGSHCGQVANMPNFTSAGWILPCCWLDHVPLRKVNFGGLFDPELNIQNVDNIKDIFRSKQWREFYYNLVNDQDKCHHICWQNCSVDIKE